MMMINLLDNIEITDDDVSVGSIEDLLREKEDCILCFDPIDHDVFVPSSHGNIRHTQGYHQACWDEYINKFDNCPLCRMVIRLPLPVEIEPDNNVYHRFIIRPIQEQPRMDQRLDAYYLNLEIILFVTTLGHTIGTGMNETVINNILKTCVSFYITGVSCKRYLRGMFRTPALYMFLFYMSFLMINASMGIYCNIILHAFDNNY